MFKREDETEVSIALGLSRMFLIGPVVIIPLAIISGLIGRLTGNKIGTEIDRSDD